jgi:hypothetical protein
MVQFMDELQEDTSRIHYNDPNQDAHIKDPLMDPIQGSTSRFAFKDQL